MRKPAGIPKGQLHRLQIKSERLQGNALADACEREVLVYTPPGYVTSERYPMFMSLAGYTGSGLAQANWKNFGLTLPERLDRLLDQGKMGPVVAVMPDCFTALGGCQYINSSAVGNYMDYLTDEVIPLVEERFSVTGGREGRAVFGKSSGGYGALMHGILRPEIWGAVASHSGDAYFEHAYFHDIPKFLNVMAKHNESVEQFLDHVWSREKLSHDEGMALMFLGMAAHYDPDPQVALGFRLPVDLHTGAIDIAAWQRWLKHDPVRLLTHSAEALRGLYGLFIDCGARDQFHLLWGARQIHALLDSQGIIHEYQEFPDDHSDIDYRQDLSLPFLYRALVR